jgi:archaellum component FlaC
MEETRKDIGKISDDVNEMKTHFLPVIDNVAEVTRRAAVLSEGLQVRIDEIYATVDDALDVAHGAIEDIERIKSDVVATIDAPLSAVRNTSQGLVTGIVKGITVVKDILESFRKNGKG